MVRLTVSVKLCQLQGKIASSLMSSLTYVCKLSAETSPPTVVCIPHLVLPCAVSMVGGVCNKGVVCIYA